MHLCKQILPYELDYRCYTFSAVATFLTRILYHTYQYRELATASVYCVVFCARVRGVILG